LGRAFLAVLLVMLASPTVYSGDLGLTQAKTCIVLVEDLSRFNGKRTACR